MFRNRSYRIWIVEANCVQNHQDMFLLAFGLFKAFVYNTLHC